jgi:hypothetical protein
MTRTIGHLSLTIAILLLTCCHDKSNRPTDIDPLFQDFLNEIPNKSLPINFSCGLPDSAKFLSDFEKYKAFIPKSVDRIFGTIESNSDNYKLIVYGYTGDDIYPTLFSYGNDGHVKDSLHLMLSGCGAADDTAIPHARVIIDKDLTLALSDTTKLIHFPGHWKKIDFKDESMPDSTFESTGDYIVDSIRVSMKTFKVSHEGRFVKQ